jgi:hypothetical protein
MMQRPSPGSNKCLLRLADAVAETPGCLSRNQPINYGASSGSYDPLLRRARS